MREVKRFGVTLRVVSAKEVDEDMLTKTELIRFGRDKFIVNVSRRDMYKFAGYDMNKLDFAYPQGMWDDPHFNWRLKNEEQLVYYYGRSSWGEPVWDDEMMRRVFDLLRYNGIEAD
jgi:hypothetical protein